MIDNREPLKVWEGIVRGLIQLLSHRVPCKLH